MNNKETFSYTYSAKEQKEIMDIRKKYVVTEDKEDKMAQLRSLDATVTQKATIAGIVAGTVGTLIMGAGLSLILSDFGKIIGSYQELVYPLGILIGVTGIVMLSFAYPLYHHTLKKEREKIAADVIRLTDELLK